MEIFGRASFRSLIHFGAFEILAVIFTCYAIAVEEGHVKPWLPTISACGEHPPENYIFRYGIVVGAMLLIVEAVALYYIDKPFSGNKTIATLGTVAAFCLGVVGVVSSNEWSVVHTTCAVIFFVLEDIMMVLLTCCCVGWVSRSSLTVKIACSSIGCVATAARLYMHFADPDISFIGADVPVLAIVEWTNTFVIAGFHWSLALDFPDDYIAEVKLSSRSKKQWDPEKGVVELSALW